MFRDLKSNGFNIEDTWTESIKYFENVYLCLCIAYPTYDMVNRIISRIGYYINIQSGEYNRTNIDDMAYTV